MSKIKVLFEAGPMMDIKKTGVGYYVSHLASSLQAAHTDKLDLTGYYFNFLNRRHKPEPTGLRFHKIWMMPGKLLSVCRRLGFQPWLELFSRSRQDAVIFTNYVALPQLRRRKTLLVVYDLSFLDTPEFTQDRNLKYLRRFCPPSIRRADVIITISEFTKQRLHYHFPGLKAEIVVTPIPPLQSTVEKADLPEDLQKLGIKKDAYILFVGTIEPRKNLEGLVAAYGLLAPAIRDRFPLVLAGAKGWKDETVLRKITESRARGINIIQTGYISEAEKSALYSNAVCFVLPSHYEGFGMPILEAMTHGAPVVLSDIPVFREVAGDAAIYFDKDKPEDIAGKISSLIENPSLQQEIAVKSASRLKEFSWQENAERVYRAL